jgi:hypothetical protein
VIASISLILIGVVLLAANLNLLSLRDIGHLLGTWWPALLIAAGIAGLVRRR